MTLLPPDGYLEHLRAESARFRDALARTEPTARVPACPEWNADDLLWHLTTVQNFWARIVIDRPTELDEDDVAPRPPSRAELLDAFDEASAALAGALDGVDPSSHSWTWLEADQTVGFILRRQAHEALIHRVDAEQTAGISSPLDAALAADGVHEILDVMYGGCPSWGSWEPLPHLLRVDCTDTGDQFWVRLGLFSGTDPDSGIAYADEHDCHVVAAPDDDTEPDVVVDGPAAALDLWLWNRGDDAEISTAGDRSVFERFRAVIDHPLN